MKGAKALKAAIKRLKVRPSNDLPPTLFQNPTRTLSGEKWDDNWDDSPWDNWRDGPIWENWLDVGPAPTGPRSEE